MPNPSANALKVVQTYCKVLKKGYTMYVDMLINYSLIFSANWLLAPLEISSFHVHTLLVLQKQNFEQGSDLD